MATWNPGKKRELLRYLSPLSIRIFSLSDLKIKETCPESGKSFLENARQKSLFYRSLWNGLTLAEDSGLVVDELGGAPGIYSARFSVPNASDERNIEKVLSLLKNTPFEKRTARFVCSMVLASQERVLTEITEKVEGYITFEQKGRWGFGYDPIFYYPPLDKTLAELEPEVKNKVSHRGRALTKLREFLKNYLK